MALRNVLTVEADDSSLRKKSREITEINEKIKTLAKDMLETLYEKNGVGLAAPQVGVLKRMIVVDIGEGPITLINPVIAYQKGSQKEMEGCLSVPGVWGIVERPEQVIVRGTTLRQSILKILDRLEPKKIVVASSSPQIRYPDYYGIDMEKFDHFVAFKAALELLYERGKRAIIDQTYRNCVEELKKPDAEQVN